ncbi:hypothetical protein TUM19329_26490 [Legionella antarctica]|uniref:Uncharacterized protein n=1 Tax=Legionella antarctica TaxID=2708020 RepID=A0A6F8T7A0_9GAMM|nr:hypothetical protein [Legionella antarctica]BCA96288.1 hypothetical protein TUM19329_26490 [Legionella antarctica]
MGISLTTYLELDEDGNLVKNENGIAKINNDLTLADHPVTSYKDYLNALDYVTVISDDIDNPLIEKIYVKELTKLLLQKFQEHLRETKSDWNDKYNPKLYTIAKQLESFAYLTGEQNSINQILDEFPLLKLIKSDYKAYQADNFLDKDAPLKFRNFDRNLLVLQMALRVLDPRFINQRNEQVCGVNTYVHNMALLNPLQYVQMVSKLASDGQVDLQDLDAEKGVLHVKVKDRIANKKRSDGIDIHDADHIILNGLRSSENSLVSYSEESTELSKQLFGVTTLNELNSWMKQSGYSNVKNISVRNKEGIKQLHMLIKDGYMAGFAGTSTLASFIVDNSQELPKKQNLFNQFMDGHLFTIKNIEYDEESDSVKIRIVTWGEDVETTIPFQVWQNHVGVVGQAAVGQNPYTSSMFRSKVREIEPDSTFCSPEGYCLYIKGLIGNKVEYKEINALLESAFKHQHGQTWMQSAKKIQDVIEALPAEKRVDVPLKISIIPSVTSDITEQFNVIHQIMDRKKKIEALEALGTQDNIEVQRQLLVLYAQQGQWNEVKNLFASVNVHSKTDREILRENLQLGCDLLGPDVTPPPEIISLIKKNTMLKADDLVAFLSEITGLPKGGAFTYGVQGRLLEVINQRHQIEGKNPISQLNESSLDKTDLVNLVSLLDGEIHKNDPSHRRMGDEPLDKFCDAIIDRIDKKPSGNDGSLSEFQSLHARTPIFKKITEFFLKVASIVSDNIISKNIGKTQEFKQAFGKAKENNLEREEPKLESSEDTISETKLNTAF